MTAKKRIIIGSCLAGAVAMWVLLAVFCGDAQFMGTAWSLLPPFVAIVLALITKEVYSSLFIGIITGALFVANFNPIKTLTTIVDEGLISGIAAKSNIGIFLFLIMLGIMVALINKAGGSSAFGEWANRNIKTRVGALLATVVFGVLIFIDDYFNCLTVGSVMRPITDRKRVSRAKLAYIIDCTAAPVCMIAPISSWAAAVSGVVEGQSGMALFLQAIPYNFYSLMTILFVVGMIVLKVDYGPMRRFERNAVEKGDLFTTGHFAGDDSDEEGSEKGKIIDLILPVIVLIGCCLLGLLYAGGILEGNNFVDALANTDASLGLPLGTIVALIITVFYFIIRGTITFKGCMDCLVKGFLSMVPAIIILTFAITLKNLTGLLGASDFVAGIMGTFAGSLASFLPAIIFLVAVFLAFATGTSWGTFGILIPIVTAVFANDPQLTVIGVSACLSGAVCGDHCSPISDTTIMSSTGARCNHIDHVSTQMPYALSVAGIAFIGYIIAGLVQNSIICIVVCTALTIGFLLVMRIITKRLKKPTEA